MQLLKSKFVFAAMVLFLGSVFIPSNSAKAGLVGFNFDTTVDLTSLGLGNKESFQVKGTIDFDRANRLFSFGTSGSSVRYSLNGISDGANSGIFNMLITVGDTIFVSGDVFDGYSPGLGLGFSIATGSPLSTRSISIGLSGSSELSLGDLLVSSISLRFSETITAGSPGLPLLTFPEDATFLDTIPNLEVEIFMTGTNADGSQFLFFSPNSPVTGFIAVSEPGAISWLCIGLLGLGLAKRQRRRDVTSTF